MATQPGNPTIPTIATEQPARDGKARTAAELRKRLARTEDHVQSQVAILRRELTLADVGFGGMPILDYVRRNPLLVVGATAGVLAGLVLVTRLSRREPPAVDEEERWLRMFLDDLLDDAAVRVARGADSDEAIRRALRNRAPVIFVETAQEERGPVRRGVVASALITVANTVVGFGLKFAMDRLTQELTGHPEVISGVQEAS